MIKGIRFSSFAIFRSKRNDANKPPTITIPATYGSRNIAISIKKYKA